MTNLVEGPGKSVHWNTPDWFIEYVNCMAPIGLDPCWNNTSVFIPPLAFTETGIYNHGVLSYDKAPEDTFTLDWEVEKDQLIFINPPYGIKVTEPFLKKATMEQEFGKSIIGLIPARTDTKAWHNYVGKASHLCLVKGRISFLNSETQKIQKGTKFPSAVVLWSKSEEMQQKFVNVFKSLGTIYSTWH